MNITIEEQRNILKVMALYDHTDKDIIKDNLSRLINRYKESHILMSTRAFCELINLPKPTIDSILKATGKYKIDFSMALVICNFLKVSITDIVDKRLNVDEVRSIKCKNNSKSISF